MFAKIRAGKLQSYSHYVTERPKTPKPKTKTPDRGVSIQVARLRPAVQDGRDSTVGEGQGCLVAELGMSERRAGSLAHTRRCGPSTFTSNTR